MGEHTPLSGQAGTVHTQLTSFVCMWSPAGIMSGEIVPGQTDRNLSNREMNRMERNGRIGLGACANTFVEDSRAPKQPIATVEGRC
jgi:hypothetical protein